MPSVTIFLLHLKTYLYLTSCTVSPKIRHRIIEFWTGRFLKTLFQVTTFVFFSANTVGFKQNLRLFILHHGGFGDDCSDKEPACQCRRYKRCGFNSWVGKILWRRKWQLTPVFLPGESHRERSLAGYSPWGCRVRHDGSDLACTYTCILHGTTYIISICNFVSLWFSMMLFLLCVSFHCVIVCSFCCV